MTLNDKILTNFSANSASFENLYSSHDSKCDYAKRPFRTFDANAKEKDYESGFHYYGSRYYSSELSIWNSTDPMADKYPSLTPYNYCANNPIKLIDPNGEEIVDADGNTMYKDGKWTNYATKEAKKYKELKLRHFSFDKKRVGFRNLNLGF